MEWPVLDRDRLAAQRQLLGAGFEVLVGEFKQETASLLPKMRAASSGDGEELSRLAGTLKGVSGCLNTTGLFELSSALESRAKEGTRQEAMVHIDLIEAELDRVIEALDGFLEA